MRFSTGNTRQSDIVGLRAVRALAKDMWALALLTVTVLTGRVWAPGITPSKSSAQILSEDMRNEIILKSCKLDPAPELEASCAVAVPAENASLSQSMQALLCYAYYDLALHWCQAKMPLESFQSLRIAGPSLAESLDVCPRLNSTLLSVTTPYTQTHHYVKRLQKAFSAHTTCTVFCFDADGNFKPLCRIILEGHERFQELLAKSVQKEPDLPKVNTEKHLKESSVKVGDDVGVKTTLPLAKAIPQIVENQQSDVPPALNPTLQSKLLVPLIPKESSNKSQTIKIDSLQEFNNNPIESPVDTPIKENDNNKLEPKSTSILFEANENIDSEPQDDDDGEMDQFDGNEAAIIHDSPASGASNSMINTIGQENRQEKVDFESAERVPIGNSYNEFVDTEDSNFFYYLLFGIGIFILCYVIYHNKNKVLGLLVEGRRSSQVTRRRGGGAAYRKLDCTLEEAVSSTPPSHGPHIVY